MLGKKRKLSRDDDCLTVAQLPMLASRERPENAMSFVEFRCPRDDESGGVTRCFPAWCLGMSF